MKIRKFLAGLIATVLGLWALPSLAVPTLTIFDDQGNSVSVQDQSAGDSANAEGTVMFMGTIGRSQSLLASISF